MTRVPGEHLPNIKNRSSKQYMCLTRIKPVVKSMNNEMLNKFNTPDAIHERKRREKKHQKKNAK